MTLFINGTCAQPLLYALQLLKADTVERSILQHYARMRIQTRVMEKVHNMPKNHIYFTDGTQAQLDSILDEWRLTGVGRFKHPSSRGIYGSMSEGEKKQAREEARKANLTNTVPKDPVVRKVADKQRAMKGNTNASKEGHNLVKRLRVGGPTW